MAKKTKPDMMIWELNFKPQRAGACFLRAWLIGAACVYTLCRSRSGRAGTIAGRLDGHLLLRGKEGKGDSSDQYIHFEPRKAFQEHTDHHPTSRQHPQ